MSREMAKLIEKTVTREIELTPVKPGETHKERILKVQSGRAVDTSQIILSGKWLREAGFRPGNIVRVGVSDNRLVLERIQANA